MIWLTPPPLTKKTAYCSEYIKQNDDFRQVSAIHVSSLIQMNILLALERF